MRHPCAWIPLLAILFIPAVHGQETLVGSVPVEYPLGNSWFHVNEETNRVWLMLRYGWPDTVLGGDTGPGLNSVPVALDVLRFDPQTRQILFESGANPVVCANVRHRRFLLWSWTAAIPTGHCVVTQREVDHIDPRNGQSVHRLMKDAFLEVR